MCRRFHMSFLYMSSLFCCSYPFSFFFFSDPSTTEIYTLSLHDALPIYVLVNLRIQLPLQRQQGDLLVHRCLVPVHRWTRRSRSEEHTSELQSRQYLVCRLLLEKKKRNTATRSQLLPQIRADSGEHRYTQ